MNARPYIGVTGVVNALEMIHVVKEFHDASYTMHSSHTPMVGVLVSYKTLNRIPADSKRYPSFKNLNEILEEADNSVMTMIHYNTRKQDTLAEQVKKVFDELYKEGLCRALQLNVEWPNVRQVAEIKQRFPEMKIVFQLKKACIQGVNPEQVAYRIGAYGDSIDYVLIDPSEGKGEEFNIEDSVTFFRELRIKTPYLTTGFAGGFKGENVAERVNNIMGLIGNREFCIDAEGGLRSERRAGDFLNIDKVSHYLREATGVLR